MISEKNSRQCSLGQGFVKGRNGNYQLHDDIDQFGRGLDVYIPIVYTYIGHFVGAPAAFVSVIPSKYFTGSLEHHQMLSSYGVFNISCAGL